MYERYSLEPEQIAHLKAVQGDASDNIPGVAGIGAKTATALLRQFGTVDGIYAHLDEVTPERTRDQLRRGEDIARLGVDLATIVTDLPLDAAPPELRWTDRFDRSRVVDLFRELEFTSLITRLPAFLQPPAEAASARQPALTGAAPAGAKAAATGTAGEVDVTVAASRDQLSALLVEAAGAPVVSFFAPAPADSPLIDAEPSGIALSWEAGRAAYIPLHHQAALLSPESDAGDDRSGLRPEEAKALLAPFLGSNGRTTIVHVARESLLPVRTMGAELGGRLWDTSVAAHLLGKPNIGLAPLALSELGEEFPTRAQLLGSGRKAVPFESLPAAEAGRYAGRAASLMLALHGRFAPQLEAQGQSDLFTTLDDGICPGPRPHGAQRDTGRRGVPAGDVPRPPRADGGGWSAISMTGSMKMAGPPISTSTRPSSSARSCSKSSASDTDAGRRPGIRRTPPSWRASRTRTRPASWRGSSSTASCRSWCPLTWTRCRRW